MRIGSTYQRAPGGTVNGVPGSVPSSIVPVGVHASARTVIGQRGAGAGAGVTLTGGGGATGRATGGREPQAATTTSAIATRMRRRQPESRQVAYGVPIMAPNWLSSALSLASDRNTLILRSVPTDVTLILSNIDDTAEI